MQVQPMQVPLNDSMKAFSIGLPGGMKSSCTPCRWVQSSSVLIELIPMIDVMDLRVWPSSRTRSDIPSLGPDCSDSSYPAP